MHPDGAAAATLVTETLGAVFGADVVRKQLLGATVRRGPPARPPAAIKRPSRFS
jgi:hypothetical protein